MGSFIANINTLAENLETIISANSIFDENVIPVLTEIADLDLDLAVQDLKKGNYLGNRKIDINLSYNMTGITEDTDDTTAETIWTDSTKTVLYESATVTFTDGTVLEIPFKFDGNPTTISTHSDLLLQLNNNVEFLAKLEDTLISAFSAPVVGEIIRLYDVVGSNSNVERLVLHAVSGDYIEQNPTYYWAKTTSSFQTLSMRAGDIIKIGNEVDNLILLANSISELLELQTRIPQLIDTFTGETPNGDTTVYNSLSELIEIHTNLTKFIALYNSLTAINTVSTNITNINTVAGISTNVTTVSGISGNVTTVANNNSNVSTVATNITSVNTNATNITAIQNASANAAIATTKASEASASAASAAASAATATTKANEIKAVTVGSTTTGAAGTNALVTYNSSTGQFAFVVPQGIKGDKGDNFTVNAVGLIADRALYDAQIKGFSFLALDEGLIYFKLSSTSGDWSVGSPFGKGDTGDTGATGNGVVSIVFTSTTDASGLAGQSGGTDTYTITYTDSTTDTIIVYNGIDGSVAMVKESFIATEGQTTFTISSSYTVGLIDVFVNGLKVLVGVDVTATDGSTIVFTEGLVENDIVDVTCFGAFQVANTYTQGQVDTLVQAVQTDVDNLTSVVGTISTDLDTVEGAVTTLQTTLTTLATEDNPSFTGAITEEVYNLTGTVVDPSNGTLQYLTLTANTTLTETIGEGQYVLLRVTYGSKTLTLFTCTPTNTLPDGSNTTDFYLFFKMNGTLYVSNIGGIA